MCGVNRQKERSLRLSTVTTYGSAWLLLSMERCRSANVMLDHARERLLLLSCLPVSVPIQG